MDSNGRNIGLGDTTCFNLENNTLTDDMLIDCAPGEEYCATEILADWEPKDRVYHNGVNFQNAKSERSSILMKV